MTVHTVNTAAGQLAGDRTDDAPRRPSPPLRRGLIDTLQVNLGYRCNQSCLHCHVNAGPNRTEEMSAQTISQVLDFLAASTSVRLLDLTGGAPELNPHSRHLVREARALGVRVIDRCNLTILEAPAAEAVGLVLVTTMLALAILEHWLLVLPLPSTALWRWAMRHPAPEPAAPRPDNEDILLHAR